MHGALAALQLVRVPFGQREPCATVLKQDAEFVRGDARSEAVEDRIDQRHDHAVAIDDSDIDGVLVHRFRDLCRTGHGAFGVDQRGQFGGRVFGQQVVQPGHVIGVRQKPVAGVIGQLGRLGLDMGALRAEGVHRRDVKILEDVQQQQRDSALTVWRMLDHFDVFVRACHGVRVGAGGIGKVLRRVRAAQCGQRRDHVLGDLAGVERIAPVLGDAAQHLCLFGRAEDFAGLGHLAVHHERLARRSLQGVGAGNPVCGHTWCYGHARFGIVDGGGQQRIKAQLAHTFGQGAERVDGTRHRYRVRAAQRHSVVARIAQHGGVQSRRCAARTVQRVDLGFAGHRP